MKRPHRDIVVEDAKICTSEAALCAAKRRLFELGHPPREEGTPTPDLASPLRHPWVWTAGALALGVGLTTLARTGAGRSIVRAAGRAAGRTAITTARVMILPAIAKTVASTVTNQMNESARFDRHLPS